MTQPCLSIWNSKKATDSYKYEVQEGLRDHGGLGGGLGGWGYMNNYVSRLLDGV